LMPGTDAKPFNLTVFVYEMLYGTDYIDALPQSADFNSVYALPGNEEEEKNEMDDDDEDEEEDKHHINDLLKIGDKCLIYAEHQWCHGLVVNINGMIDREQLEVSFGIRSENNERLIIESKETLSRYDSRLIFNEKLTNEQRLQYKQDWQVGSRCIYFVDDLQQWCRAKVIRLFGVDNKCNMMQIEYENGFDAEIITKMVTNDRSFLIKPKWIQIECEEIGGANEDIKKEEDEEEVNEIVAAAEGPLQDESYIVVQAIGNEKAENDEDLVDANDVDMELENEEEGV